MDGWVDGRMDGWTDGWMMDRWIEGQIRALLYSHCPVGVALSLFHAELFQSLPVLHIHLNNSSSNETCTVSLLQHLETLYRDNNPHGRIIPHGETLISPLLAVQCL